MYVYLSEYPHIPPPPPPMQEERRKGADSFDSKAKKMAMPNKLVSVEDRG